ncbi:hypothetical protein ND864_17420 [Leptospira levettii]|uniref:hypothetical protein n=1 Tax=Leptospira levettii TaxID=2023178 RepID=UPI00223E3604|nr:hypothetical protein [Leptospira levettii]MCW7467503.1 hypothetical protein [Leptospira levettii]
MAEVLIDIDSIASKLAQKLGPEIVSEISKRQKGAGGGSESGNRKTGGSSGGGEKPKKKELTENQKRNQSLGEGYQAGADASPLDQDSSELRSGRFSGIINRKIQSARKFKDTTKNEWDKYKIKTGKSDKDDGNSEDSGHGLGVGAPSPNAKSKYNILEVKEARIMNLYLKGALGGSGAFGGGVGIPGRGGGTGSPYGPEGGTPPGENTQTKTMSKTAAIVAPALMGAGALAGFILSTISTMAGMNQQAKQAQEGTFGAYGGYVGQNGDGGGGLMRNTEVANMSIARARILGGGAMAQNLNNSSSLLGAKFGLTQGIGGAAGAELFAKMEKFGGFGSDESSLKKIMSDGIRSGFTGLRTAEFMQQVMGISENAYNSGMGIQSADKIAGTLSNLSSAGIRDNRLNSVYSAMNDNMTKDGGQMNSMLVAHHMQQNGGDYLAAMAAAEEGMGSSGNIGAINRMTQGMDPKTKAIWMKKQGIITATEGQKSVSLGKDLMDVAQQTTVSQSGAVASENVANYGGRNEKGGQTHIQHANKLDSLALTEVFDKANDIQNKIFDAMMKMADNLDGQYKKIKKKASMIGIDL